MLDDQSPATARPLALRLGKPSPRASRPGVWLRILAGHQRTRESWLLPQKPQRLTQDSQGSSTRALRTQRGVTRRRDVQQGARIDEIAPTAQALRTTWRRRHNASCTAPRKSAAVYRN